MTPSVMAVPNASLQTTHVVARTPGDTMHLTNSSVKSRSSHSDPLDGPATEQDRWRSFAGELDALHRRVLEKVGPDDVEYIRTVDRFSQTMQVVGRVLIHVSCEPASFFIGVGALWIHKQLQTAEIGHSALHGAWDHLPGCKKFSSRTFRWDTPIDEESWQRTHNVMHHSYTNVAGRDPDIHFGFIRLTEQTPHSWRNRLALPFGALTVVPNFLFVINSHVTGLNDVLSDNGRPEKLDVLRDRTLGSVRGACRRALRKYVPYYFKEYGVYPALAGPFFWKVALGNFLAELLRSAYTAATVFCGHVGADVESWPAGTRAHGRGEWYAMQVRATNDFEVSLPISILCGGLERQIEHHLFPTLPPRRLREIAPDVRAICKKYGVPYKTATWGGTLQKVFAHVVRLSRPTEETSAKAIG